MPLYGAHAEEAEHDPETPIEVFASDAKALGRPIVNESNLRPEETTMSVTRARKRGILSVVAVAGLSLGAVLASPSAYGVGIDGSESGAAVSVTLRNGFISVEAQDAALGDILQIRLPSSRVCMGVHPRHA